MSLLSDPEWVSIFLLTCSTSLTERSSHDSLLIHSLRLGYLRNVEDPYGPRLISFNPTFPTNPYITAASLADVTKWPELGITSPSPPLSPDDSDGGGSGSGSGDPASAGTSRPRSVSGFPGATGLKHTQTILGPSRTGALGMGVSGRRRHVSKPSSSSSRTGSFASARERELDSVGTSTTTVGTTSTGTAKTTFMSKSPPPQQQLMLQEQQQQQQQLQQLQHASASSDPPPLKPVFVPKFKGAAEMDERRRLRLQARRGAAAEAAAAGGAGGGAPGIRVVALLEGGATVDLMSSGEEGGEEEEELEEELEEEEEDSFSQVGDEDFVDVGGSVDIDEDEFDPCVVTTLFLISLSDSLFRPHHWPIFFPPFTPLLSSAHTRAAQGVRYYAFGEHDIRQRLGRPLGRQREPVHVQLLQRLLPAHAARSQSCAPEPGHGG